MPTASIVETITQEAEKSEQTARAAYVAIVTRAAVDSSEPGDVKKIRELLPLLNLTARDLESDINAVKQAGEASREIIAPEELDNLHRAALALAVGAVEQKRLHEAAERAIEKGRWDADTRYRAARQRSDSAAAAVATLHRQHPRAFAPK